MKRKNLRLVIALLMLAATGASCHYLKTYVVQPMQNPTFQQVTGAIAEACGPQYGAMARVFFRVIGTQTEATIVRPSPATTPRPAPSPAPSPVPSPTPSPAPPPSPPPGNVHVYTPSNRPAVPQAAPEAPKPTDLQVEFEVLKEAVVAARFTATRISDGDTLTEQDNYRVYFRVNMDCHVYIVQLDSTGRLDPIF
ncbi:MAG: DUF4384 domain-containing protein, partial [Planctomycetes bacterium]|nr:DUF4384 domain-containing protein [Planctomycetota bacterium]